MTALARRVLGLIDLTELGDRCADDDVRRLCAAAVTPYGAVPAVCVWPAFVAPSRRYLEGTGVLVATVVNFPAGGDDVRAAVAETVAAIEAGADEIDVVVPYRSLLTGRPRAVADMVAAVKAVAGELHVKAILETGELPDQTWVAAGGELAIEGGADFLKTSTGKTARSATPEAVHTMLEVIRGCGREVGVKPSGGIRDLARGSASYLTLADAVMGDAWATVARFRFGASSLLAAVLADLEAGPGAAAGPPAAGVAS